MWHFETSEDTKILQLCKIVWSDDKAVGILVCGAITMLDYTLNRLGDDTHTMFVFNILFCILNRVHVYLCVCKIPVTWSGRCWNDFNRKGISMYVIAYIHTRRNQEKQPGVFNSSPLVTHMCVVNQVSIGSVNGLSPIRGQAIIWTNVHLLSIGPLGRKFSEIRITMQNFSFKKMHFWKCRLRNGGQFVQGEMS